MKKEIREPLVSSLFSAQTGKGTTRFWKGKSIFVLASFLCLLTSHSRAQVSDGSHYSPWPETADSTLRTTIPENDFGIPIELAPNSWGVLVGDSRPTYERSTGYGIGFANVFDTYLSPQAYRGTELRILRESRRITGRSECSWQPQMIFQGLASYTKHPSDDNKNISILAEWRWGYLYQFRPIAACPGLELFAGPQLYGEGGLIYNMANGNNPVAVKLGAGVGATGMALWNFEIKNCPLTLRYQFFAPLMGAFFSPHYGQSYYEIFSLGNSSGVVRFSSLHNKPSLWQHLSLDFQVFKRHTLRLSYVADIRQTKVNHLKYHQWSHVFMLGLVHRFRKL